MTVRRDEKGGRYVRIFTRTGRFVGDYARISAKLEYFVKQLSTECLVYVLKKQNGFGEQNNGHIL